MSDHLIEVEGLTKRFGDVHVLRDVSFRVPRGAIFGYLGLNGAGKTTTIRILSTLLEPTSGVARVAGIDVTADPDAVRRAIGLVGEEGAEGRPSWTPREYVRWFADLRALDRPAQEAERVLQAVGLDGAASRRALGACSTGTRRRADIARALLGEPRVLLLDEPTRGLDLPSRIAMWDQLRAFAEEQDLAILLSSHDAREIHALCDGLAIVSRGRITYQGRAAELGTRIEDFESRLVRFLGDNALATFHVEPVPAGARAP